MKKYQWAVTIDVLICLHRFYLTLELQKPRAHTNGLFWQLVINYIIALAEDWTYYFWFAHLNQVLTDIAYGSTIIGIFTSINNASDWGVNPIGLRIIAIVEYFVGDHGYDYAVGVFTVLALVSLCLTWKNAYVLDEMEVEEYRIMERQAVDGDAQAGGVELGDVFNLNSKEVLLT